MDIRQGTVVRSKPERNSSPYEIPYSVQLIDEPTITEAHASTAAPANGARR